MTDQELSRLPIFHVSYAADWPNIPALYCINRPATFPNSFPLVKAIPTVVLGNKVLGVTSTTAFGFVFTSRKDFVQDVKIKTAVMKANNFILIFMLTYLIIIKRWLSG